MTNHTIETVRALLDDCAEKYGKKTFLKFFRDGFVESRSFLETRTDALAVCRWIRSLNPQRMHVAFVAKTSYEYIICMTGILISGNVGIPLSPEISAEEAAILMKRADVDMLLYDDTFADKAADAAKGANLLFSVDIGDAASFEHIYYAYGDDSEYASLSDIQVDPDAAAVMIYTSGTTGVKKAVMLSSKALVGNIMYHDYITDVFRPNDVALSVLPMYHVYSFTGDYLKNMKDGLQVALNGDLRYMTANLLRFEPRVIRVVPMIAQTLLRCVRAVHNRNPHLTAPEAARLVFGRNIKWLISGGAYLPPRLIEEYEQLDIYLRQGYGMTEAGCRISVPDPDADKSSVGRVIDICTARVQNGEIQVNTPTKMLGYYKMPQESAALFTPDGWLRTGDIGRLTEDGQLFITGRVKNLIILSSGENVSPEAIEKKFNDVPLIQEVMVYGENDRIVAEFYPNNDYAEENNIDDIDGILEALVDEMNKSAKPSHVIAKVKIRREPFEKTGSGKIKRPRNV